MRETGLARLLISLIICISLRLFLYASVCTYISAELLDLKMYKQTSDGFDQRQRSKFGSEGKGTKMFCTKQANGKAKKTLTSEWEKRKL